MGLFNLNKDSLEATINYVLDTEMEDFQENPSNNHVFYHAFVCAYGKQEADKVLERAEKGESLLE